MNKNHAARLRRVNKHMDRVLDALHAARGELYPAELKSYRDGLEDLMDGVEALRANIVRDVPAAIGGRPRAVDVAA
jgi:hypothetical protein